ncbi:MAG: MTH1187 family thiamine-binding protein [Desulfobacterales bacterium]
MLASFSIVPMGKGEQVKDEVAKVLDIVDRSGLNYRAGAMETTVEGSEDEVMELIMQCHNLMKTLAPRVLTSIKIDDRMAGENRLTGKLEDVEEVLGRKLKHE